MLLIRPSQPELPQTRPALRWLVTSLLLLLAPVFASARQDNAPVIQFVRNPDPAPEFKLTSLDGKPIALENLRGKVVFLNFWATWCGPCRAEIPDLVELQNEFKDRLQIIGLDVDDDDVAEVEKYAKETGINYPVAMATDAIRDAYGGIPALPTSFVLDTEGRVVQKHTGLLDPSLYDSEIRALLGLPIAARVETFEDTGEVFLKHADRATELPGVNLSKLTAEQKKIALHRFNAETCTCGCKFTLAQCRIWDSACAVSKAATEKIIAKLSAAPQQPSAAPASPDAPSPSAPAPAAKPTPPSQPASSSPIKTPAASSPSQPKE
ncbi:MAG: TlpA disulfide reductase family protein [Candidatus Acidiferrum sp.]